MGSSDRSSLDFGSKDRSSYIGSRDRCSYIGSRDRSSHIGSRDRSSYLGSDCCLGSGFLGVLGRFGGCLGGVLVLADGLGRSRYLL